MRRKLENVTLIPVLVSIQTHPISVVSEAEMLLFNQLLEGQTLENGVIATDPPSEETFSNDEAEEEQTVEMDEVLLLEMQKLIRMPVQPQLKPESVEQRSIEQPVLAVTIRAPIPETLKPIENQVAKTLPEESVLQQVLERTESEGVTTQWEKLDAEEKAPEKISEQLPGKKLEQLPEKLQTLEIVSTERGQFLAPALPQPNTAVPAEIIKTTLVWQEPTQVIRELGETITLTLEHSPAPTAKTIQIALTPEAFGEMEIQLTFQEERVEAVIVVQKNEIKQQLLERLDQIRVYLPQNPIVHKITIEVASPIQMPLQSQFEQSRQSRKQSQSHSKNDPRETFEREEQQEGLVVSLANGFNVYV